MEKRRFESFEVFSCLKKVNPRILSTFKRSFSTKMGKNQHSHIIHSLGGEYCCIVRDSEPIRLLKSLRRLSFYILDIVIIIVLSSGTKKKKKTSDVFYCISLERLNNALFCRSTY